MARLSIHGRSIDIPDLNKVVFPGEGVMKGDVLHYYYRLAPLMMPHLRGRTLSLRGVGDVSARVSSPSHGDVLLPDWVRTLLPERRGAPSLLVADEPAVLGVLVQRSCITPHASLSRVGSLRRPDRLVFDLDPSATGPEAHLEVCEAARVLAELVVEAGLVPFVMTSGSRGVHVHVPIYPQRLEVACWFAGEVARRAVAAHPRRLALAGRDGAGRVVTIRALPADHRSTFVAPYALRDLPGAPVATPLSWDELGAGTGSQDHTITSVFARLARRGDPWRELDKSARLPPIHATGVGVTA